MRLPPYWSNLPPAAIHEIAPAISWTKIRAADGYLLDAYEMGRRDAETIVLINALGLPFALLARLGLALSERFHVVGWDARGCPEITDPFEDRFASVDVQAADLLRINDHFGGAIGTAVTWSSGAFVLLKAMKTGFASCRHRVLLAPSDITSYGNRTPFLAYFERWFVKAATGDVADVERLRAKIIAGLSVKEDVPARALNTVYVGDVEGTRRYVRYFKAGLDFRSEVQTLYSELARANDFLIIHAIDDVFSDHRGSLQAVEGGVRTRLTLYPSGGHFLMHGEPRAVADEVTACVERGRHAALHG